MRETREVTVEGGGLGIRLGDKTAGTGCLAGSRSYCALVLNKSLCGSRSQEELVSHCFYWSFSPENFIWITKKTVFVVCLFIVCFLLRWNVHLFPTSVCWILLLSVSWHWYSNGGLPEEEPPLSAVCVQEEG